DPVKPERCFGTPSRRRRRWRRGERAVWQAVSLLHRSASRLQACYQAIPGPAARGVVVGGKVQPLGGELRYHGLPLLAPRLEPGHPGGPGDDAAAVVAPRGDQGVSRGVETRRLLL